ncbi:MAG: Bug family tripartite tricarboxylate transporter substrate binding protein [Burkholderiales bacterium]
MRNRFLSVRIWVAAIAGLGISIAYAQPWPAKPVRVIVQAPVGGPTDIVTRGASQMLTQTLGQAFVVENRAGANGILGAETCMRAAPDGYSICGFNAQAISQNPVMVAKLPYEPAKDFLPIVHLGSLRSALSVNVSLSAGNVTQLFELAKSKPGSLNWATYGPTSNSHLYLEWLKSTRDLSFLNVPYKTAGQAFTSMVAGETQIAIYSTGNTVQMAKAGKIRVLAVIGEGPSPFLPGVPSFKEAGIGLQIGNWTGLFAPAGFPVVTIQRINTEVAKMMATAEFREKFMSSVGLEPEAPAGRPVEEFASFLRVDRAAAESMARVIGIKPE